MFDAAREQRTSESGVLELLRELRDDGPHDRIPEVFEQNYVEAWYGFDPLELRSVLDAAPDHELRPFPIATYIRALLRGEPTRLLEDAKHNGLKADSATGLSLVNAMASLEARFKGELRVALEILEPLRASDTPGNMLVDGTSGAASFLAMQAGITRMLAGDFRGALGDFERTKWTEPPADLMFFLRDAHAKSALVHALVGDPDLARIELASAAAIERTGSWAEGSVDATARLASLLLDSAEPAQALSHLLSTSRREIGELWPYLLAGLTPLALGGDPQASNLMMALESADLPGASSGEGFTGSVVSLARAALASTGAAARTALATADPELTLTALATAGLAIDAGNPATALAAALRISPETAGLRQLELWRLCVVIAAHGALDEHAAADAAQQQAERLTEGMPRFGLAVSGTVGHLVQAILRREEAPEAWYTSPLTSRELEILKGFAAGLNRKEIAEELFLSPNTIKSQASSLYRKLGVTTRDALLAVAYDRGLL